MVINGVEISDIDVCDLAAMERYEAAHDVVMEKASKAKQVCERRSELIKYQCEAIFEFLDTAFGEGTAKKVFGESVNLRTCMNVYEEVCLAVNKLDESYGAEVKDHFSKYKHQKKNGGKIYPNPNHRKKKKRR